MKKPINLFNGDKGLVLNSGGIDSTTCVGLAVDYFGKENTSTVSFFYGQKHSKELECAEQVAKYYGVEHYLLNIADILKYSKNCSLMGISDVDIELKTYSEQIKESDNGVVSTYVPFRNGLMLSSAASLAYSIYPDCKVDIVIGAHSDDFNVAAYADCSAEFIEYMTKSINSGTYGSINVVAPFIDSTKDQIVGVGLKIKVPYNLTWSCYLGGEEACGKCATCLDRLKAFKKNAVKDPIKYKEEN